MKKDGKHKKEPMKKLKHMDVKEDKKMVKDMVKPCVMKKSARGR